jgi:hypothetical protein
VNGAANRPAVALRRFRFPIPARVRVEHDRPVHVAIDRRGLSGGRVEACAGPWRTSGGWWSEAGSRTPDPGSRPAWNRDEWDVTLEEATYRVCRDRATGGWFVEGVYD